MSLVYNLYPINVCVRGFVAFGERVDDESGERTAAQNLHAVELKSVEKVGKSDEKTETEWQEMVRKKAEVSKRSRV